MSKAKALLIAASILVALFIVSTLGWFAWNRHISAGGYHVTFCGGGQGTIGPFKKGSLYHGPCVKEIGSVIKQDNRLLLLGCILLGLGIASAGSSFLVTQAKQKRTPLAPPVSTPTQDTPSTSTKTTPKKKPSKPRKTGKPRP
jgi:hypothetical protein